MRLLILFLATLLYRINHSGCRQYHYNAPQRPFLTETVEGSAISTALVPPPAPLPPPPPPASAVAATINTQPSSTYYVTKAAGGKQYELQMFNSRRVFEAVQPASNTIGAAPYTPYVSPNVNPLLPGSYQLSTQGGQPAASFAVNAPHQTQYQQQTTHLQHVQQPFAGGNLGYSNEIAAGPAAYNGQTYAGAQLGGAAAVPGGAYYGGQQAGAAQAGHSYAQTAQNAPNYGGGNVGAVTNNAIATTATGINGATGNAGGAGGAGVAGATVNQHGSSLLGNQILPYNAQSQVGQLDHYPHKQIIPGDTRGFTRIVTTCGPDGRCERITLGSEQLDPFHAQVLQDARARVSPASDKCKRIASGANLLSGSIQGEKGYGIYGSSGGYIKTGSYGGSVGSGNAGGFGGFGGSGGASVAGGSSASGSSDDSGTYPDPSVKRPRDRRLFPYTEIVIPRDTYN